ncbi:hypothetical protein ACE7GA_25110 [Roseomonas sp. CCTCC AB2023176]|uniref:hypothetical protein n=1 Tax=Roseomonas sp. CCTCC AB2023176 TaxID=3342640 RepID=UPI0035DA19A8
MSKRLLIAGLAAAALATPAFAQQACVQPAEQTAFQVRALQSQLMVAALTCAPADNIYAANYRQFLDRYKPQLEQAFRTMQGHYRRTAGAGNRGERALDQHVTTLANINNQDGTRQGSLFCRNAASLFQQALAAPQEMGALATVAQNNNLANPHGRAECTTPAAATPSGNSARGRNRSADSGTVRTAEAATR